MQDNNENQQKNSNYTNENPETDSGRKSVADNSNNWEGLGLDKTNIEGATLSGAGSGPGTGDPDTSTGSISDIDAELEQDTETGSAILGTDDRRSKASGSGIRSGAEDKNSGLSEGGLDPDTGANR